VRAHSPCAAYGGPGAPAGDSEARGQLAERGGTLARLPPRLGAQRQRAGARPPPNKPPPPVRPPRPAAPAALPRAPPQLAAAGLLIGLVATKLNNIKMSFDPEHLSAKVTDTCLLGAASNGVNLCYVAYGVGGVSILATAALSVLMCCTCNLCGLGFLLDTIFALVGTAWWVGKGCRAWWAGACRRAGGCRRPGLAAIGEVALLVGRGPAVEMGRRLASSEGQAGAHASVSSWVTAAVTHACPPSAAPPPTRPPRPRWALAGVLYNYYTQQPDIVDLPQAEWRRWVVLLCWVRPRARAAAAAAAAAARAPQWGSRARRQAKLRTRRTWPQLRVLHPPDHHPCTPRASSLPPPRRAATQIGCAFFGAALLVNLYRILAKCCGCLTCGGGEGRRDMEKGYGGRAAYMPTQFTPAGAPPPGYFGRGGRQGQFVAY
jgi:hypothetical protein